MGSSSKKIVSLRNQSEIVSVDTIFCEPKELIPPFTFNKDVAEVFDDMAVRSIPGYLELQACSFHIAERFLLPETTLYDLGCSTGTTLVSIAPIVQERAARVHALDSSPSMIERAKEKTRSIYNESPITWHVQSIEEVVIQDASLVLLHYVLQFTEPSRRKDILKNIYAGLVPGGALFLSEKVILNHPEAAFIESLYYGFKRRNGYSVTEILQKRKALEGVLRPLTLEDNLTLLKEAGFPDPIVILENYQFLSILAVKR